MQQIVLPWRSKNGPEYAKQNSKIGAGRDEYGAGRDEQGVTNGMQGVTSRAQGGGGGRVTSEHGAERHDQQRAGGRGDERRA
eukprot:4004554-Pleurochrysis_carterae.AAC.1